MRTRSVLPLLLGVLVSAFVAAQTPSPQPSQTSPPSQTPPPSGGTMPPGYACQDPDTGVWVTEGGSRTKVTSPPLTGGTQTIIETYVCHSGSWRIWKRSFRFMPVNH